MNGIRIVIAAAALAASACRSTEAFIPPTPEQEAALQERYERRRLARAGLEPLEALSGRGFDVQRADFMWDLLDYPAVELMRDREGRVTISLKFWGHELTEPVEPALWQQLEAEMNGAFVMPSLRALRRRDREVIRQSGHCHGWHELEAVIDGRVRRITASPCSAELQRRSLAYAESLARAAIANISLCAPDRELDGISDALRQCGLRFGRPMPSHLAIE